MLCARRSQTLPSSFSYGSVGLVIASQTPLTSTTVANWVGTFATGSLPKLNAIAARANKAGTAYSVIAVGNYGFAVRATIPVGNAYSNSPTAPAVQFSPFAIGGLTTGVVGDVYTVNGWSYASPHLYGIVWDNAMVGYIWGNSGVYETHDGGVTWSASTPSTVIVKSLTPAFVATGACAPRRGHKSPSPTHSLSVPAAAARSADDALSSRRMHSWRHRDRSLLSDSCRRRSRARVL